MNSLRHQLAHRGIVLWASKYNGSCRCFCIVQWLWYRALPVRKEPHKDSIIRSCRLGTLAAGYIFVSIGNFMCVGEMVSSNSCLFLFVRVLDGGDYFICVLRSVECCYSDCERGVPVLVGAGQKYIHLHFFELPLPVLYRAILLVHNLRTRAEHALAATKRLGGTYAEETQTCYDTGAPTFFLRLKRKAKALRVYLHQRRTLRNEKRTAMQPDDLSIQRITLCKTNKRVFQRHNG